MSAGPYITQSQTQQQRLQMVLAPQLRQSLEFLQVPLLELRSLVQQEIEQNPTLEERLADSERIEVETPALEPKDESIKDFGEEYEVLAQIDDDWKDFFRESTPRTKGSQEDDERHKHFLDSISQPESLQEHLLHQLALTDLPPEEQQIGELLIGHINEDGYLAVLLDEVALSLNIDPNLVRRVHQVIRDFDPIGVGSFDLTDCLLFQIARDGKAGTLAEAVVRDHLETLGAHKYLLIARQLKTTAEEIQHIAHYIATLDPRPGRRFSVETASYVVPEVTVQKINGSYTVILNSEQLPHLRISKQYRALMEAGETTAEVKQYIMEKIRSGAFLIKSIHQRQRTIASIATEIVRVQEGFMDHGVKELKPLTMSEVAAVLDIHETTVSRAVSGKYMQTPQGVYEMKYFFTPGYKTASGESVSNKSIIDRIAQLISAEDPARPLSDQRLANLLKTEGVDVARRTVAKYREELKIMPSHMRKGY
jgi:RNA polymerase sigma-54 factor